jgi:hypothetical protein
MRNENQANVGSLESFNVDSLLQGSDIVLAHATEEVAKEDDERARRWRGTRRPPDSVLWRQKVAKLELMTVGVQQFALCRSPDTLMFRRSEQVERFVTDHLGTLRDSGEIFLRCFH